MYLSKKQIASNLAVVKTSFVDNQKVVTLMRSARGHDLLEGITYDEKVATVQLSTAIQNILEYGFWNMWDFARPSSVISLKVLSQVDTASFLSTENDSIYVAVSDMDVCHFLYDMPEDTPTLLIFPSSGMKVMKKPYTATEIIEKQKGDIISGVVRINLQDAINGEFDDFLDLISNKLVDSPCLVGSTYEIVGVEPENYILVKVTGHTSMLDLDDDILLEEGALDE